MSEWQPIETAPKDGTKILACCEANGMVHISVVWWRGDKYPDSLYKWRHVLNDSTSGGFAETLPNRGAFQWMPLPDLPKT